MTFNFDQQIDRRHSDSQKWLKYQGKDILPMWVADTDFRAPQPVLDALQQRIAHGVLGYGDAPKSLAKLVVNRMQQRYQWTIEAEWLVFLPGVVSGLNLAVRAFTDEQGTTIHPYPIYPPFVKSALLAQRSRIPMPMKLDNDRWLPDLAACEAALSGKEQLLMLCNPHNPGGTIYRRAELQAQLAFAERHNLLICSDEIHCDLLLDPGAEHIPIATLSPEAEQRTVTLIAPSKTYNIAGLGASIAIIPNKKLRNKFIATRMGIVPSVDILAYVAAEAAYRDGDAWLAAQLAYLRNNRDLLVTRINQMPGLKTVNLQATYLAWIDASALPVDNPHQFFEQAGVGLSPGSDFGDPRFVRMNFGCTRALLNEALDRMQKAIERL